MAVEHSGPQSSTTQSTADSRGCVNESRVPPLASSPERQLVRPSLLSSSPPPLASNDEDRARNFKSTAGPTPGRLRLAQMMGVKYTDKTQKTYLRSRVKEFVLRFIDMSKAFTEYNFTETMYPIIKGCTSYMNRQVLATSGIQWTRHVTQHVIHSIFEDTRRNEGSKEKSAAKRKEKRALAVSLETSAFSKALFLLTRNHMQVGSSSSSQVLESSQPEEPLVVSTSQVGENKSGLYERTTSLGLDTHPPVRSEFDLNQGLTPQAASYPAAISRKRRDPNNPLFPPSRAPNTREKSTSSLTPHHSASSKKHDDFKRRSRPQETLTKVLLPPGVVKVIPMSGILQYPPFYVVLGSPWNILFVNLTM